ncbi:unnamed protein product [Sphagnum tenellum]
MLSCCTVAHTLDDSFSTDKLDMYRTTTEAQTTCSRTAANKDEAAPDSRRDWPGLAGLQLAVLYPWHVELSNQIKALEDIIHHHHGGSGEGPAAAAAGSSTAATTATSPNAAQGTPPSPTEGAGAGENKS